MTLKATSIRRGGLTLIPRQRDTKSHPHSYLFEPPLCKVLSSTSRIANKRSDPIQSRDDDNSVILPSAPPSSANRLHSPYAEGSLVPYFLLYYLAIYSLLPSSRTITLPPSPTALRLFYQRRRRGASDSKNSTLPSAYRAHSRCFALYFRRSTQHRFDPSTPKFTILYMASTTSALEDARKSILEDGFSGRRTRLGDAAKGLSFGIGTWPGILQAQRP